MPFDTVLHLLDTMEQTIQELDQRHNILTCNNNALMVLFTMYLTT